MHIYIYDSALLYIDGPFSHSEDDHFLIFVPSVWLLSSELADESYAGSELLVTV